MGWINRSIDWWDSRGVMLKVVNYGLDVISSFNCVIPYAFGLKSLEKL